MAELTAVLTDLHEESADLDGLVSDLTPDQWDLPTPAAGWTIAHQIAHLTWTDEISTLAASDAGKFGEWLTEVGKRPDAAEIVDASAAERAGLAPVALLGQWRIGRTNLHDALLTVAPGAKIPWFGPPMGATSMATARIMETWAHGQDVADTLGVTRTPTDRLRHVAHLAVRAKGFAYAVHGRTPPGEDVTVQLTGPSGDVWTWGPEDGTARITGSAVDFCLLATRRRHRNDLSLNAVGAAADEWLDIIQAFAGSPGAGREPGQFA